MRARVSTSAIGHRGWDHPTAGPVAEHRLGDSAESSTARYSARRVSAGSTGCPRLATSAAHNRLDPSTCRSASFHPGFMDALEQVHAALSGRYDVEREIGAGGMAIVYLARDLRHDRKVA